MARQHTAFLGNWGGSFASWLRGALRVGVFALLLCVPVAWLRKVLGVCNSLRVHHDAIAEQYNELLELFWGSPTLQLPFPLAQDKICTLRIPITLPLPLPHSSSSFALVCFIPGLAALVLLLGALVRWLGSCCCARANKNKSTEASTDEAGGGGGGEASPRGEVLVSDDGEDWGLLGLALLSLGGTAACAYFFVPRDWDVGHFGVTLPLELNM